MGACTAAGSEEVPTLSEVQAAVSVLKIYKAAGGCGISPEMIKYGGQDGLKTLHMLIFKVRHSGVLPKDWWEALIVPLFRKDNPTNIDNYRGISLLSLPWKAFAIVSSIGCRNGLKVCCWRANVVSERADLAMMPCSASTGCQSLHTRQAMDCMRGLYDLSKAYDSGDMPLAWELSGSMGFPQKMLQLIKDILSKPTCAMQADKDKQGSWFQCPPASSEGM